MKKQNYCPRKSYWKKISALEQKRIVWIEPMQDWIEEAENMPKIAKDSNFFAKKVACQNIFDSNLILQNREARISAPRGIGLPFKKHWAALCAASKMAPQKPKSFIVERETGIEPAIFSLATRRSTTKLLPLVPLVPRVGNAPTTPSFSEKCSTSELPRHGGRDRI